jgi:hypothetical protein
LQLDRFSVNLKRFDFLHNLYRWSVFTHQTTNTQSVRLHATTYEIDANSADMRVSPRVVLRNNKRSNGKTREKIDEKKGREAPETQTRASIES